MTVHNTTQETQTMSTFCIYRKETKGPMKFMGSSALQEGAQILLEAEFKKIGIKEESKNEGPTETKEASADDGNYIVRNESSNTWEEYKNQYSTVVVSSYFWNEEKKILKPELVAEWGIFEVPSSASGPVSGPTSGPVSGPASGSASSSADKVSSSVYSDKELYSSIATSILEDWKKKATERVTETEAEKAQWVRQKKEKIIETARNVERLLFGLSATK